MSERKRDGGKTGYRELVSERMRELRDGLNPSKQEEKLASEREKKQCWGKERVMKRKSEIER